MANTAVTVGAPSSSTRSFDLRVVMAFLAIYVLWGTTFLAIRIAVHEVPPLFAAGVRFFTAGVLLYVFTRLRGTIGPTRLEWKNLAVIGFVMFVAEYGPLFWAEKYLTSGLTSILAATVPLITIALEMLVFHMQPFRWGVMGATLLGFFGVGVLVLPNNGGNVALVPCLAVLLGSMGWALGSVLQRRMKMPASRPLTSGGAMMLGGAGLLMLSGMFGELHPFPHVSLRAALALGYLITCGSLLAFTAFVWLLGRMPASKISSHAYVNPVVAVALGYFVAKEQLTGRTLVGAAIVLVSVFLILRTNRPAKA
ncbi:drug/metabolite transporter (DMT)-like permease [Edaphobacter aggregans]|uniref:Drug/metabolite transporter (DMT)-like permease n=1 Tax=Edaphobacter aggregans TaxID=570835 RepID=A0A3R9QAK7_9BACT|nr:EamA family transporter [Edaphobacter aggregans]RSL17209.1 drug/metabolite transporter (DMT)-like permease [Edaphobacter aggregans]